MPKKFKDLTEREILALAIQLEEEDSRIYGDFAEGFAKVSGDGQSIRGNAGRGIAPSPNADRHVPAAVRRTYPADPPRKT